MGELLKPALFYLAITSSFFGDLPHGAEQESRLPINNRPLIVTGIGGSQMAALARTLSRALHIDVDVEDLKIIAIFCGAGLLVSLMAASYGVDLSPGFF